MFFGLGMPDAGLFDKIFDDLGKSSEAEAEGGSSRGSIPKPILNLKKHKHPQTQADEEDSQRTFKKLSGDKGGGFAAPLPVEKSLEDVKKIFLTSLVLPIEEAIESLKDIISYSNSRGYPVAKLDFKLLEKNRMLKERVSREIVDLDLLTNVLKKPAFLNTLSPEQCSETLCLAAIQKQPSLFRENLPSQKMRNVCKQILRNSPKYFKYVDISLKDREMCDYALSKGAESFIYFPEVEKTEEVCLKVLQTNPDLFKYTPLEIKTYDFCFQIVKRFGGALKDVPRNLVDEPICLEALKTNKSSLEFVPAKWRTYELCLRLLRECSLSEVTSIFKAIPAAHQNLDICLLGVKKAPSLLNLIKSDKILFQVFEELFASDSTFTFYKHSNQFLNYVLALHPLIIHKVSDRYKRKVDWWVMIAPEIKEEMQAFIEHSSAVGSVERLLAKLRTYVSTYYPESHPYQELIKTVKDRLESHKAFLGTPPEGKKEALDGWYLHIKSLLKNIETALDDSGERDLESKEQLMQLFSVCGGGWQGQLEQMHSRLVVYRSAPAKIMIGLVIKQFADGLIEQIYGTYRRWLEDHLEDYPDMNLEDLEADVVHSINYFHMVVDPYLPSKVLEDHLTKVKWRDATIERNFLEHYTTAALVKEVSEECRREGSALQEELSKYIQSTMFKGCPTTPEFDKKIATDRDEFQELLQTYEENRANPWHQLSLSVSTGLTKAQVFLKTPTELLKAFDERYQIKVEELAIEKFNEKYREEITGYITDEGLKEILESMGFLACRVEIFSPS